MKSDLRAVLDDLPALGEILTRARKKYVSLSRLGGELSLSSREREAARKIGCKVTRTGRLKLEELDWALTKTVLQRGLVPVLEEIENGPIQTRLAVQEHIARTEKEYLGALRTAAVTDQGRTRLEAWCHADRRYLRQEALRDGAIADAVPVVRALDALPEEDSDMLASFSARLTSNAHTYDADQPSGRLLLRALRALYPGLGLSGPLSSADREELLAAAGILIDDVSSDVLLIGVTSASPTLQAAVVEWLPLRLPLYALDRLNDIRPAQGNTVFMVENPPVFRILMERSENLPAHARPALICTSGHFSLAAQRLVHGLVDRGIRIRYSGDFDLRGVEIALAVRDGYPHAIELWRMAPPDHMAALAGAGSGPPLSDAEVARLRRRSVEYAELLSRGTAHQENIVELLWHDIAEEVR